MNTLKHDKEAQIALLEKTFRRLADKPAVPEPAVHDFRLRKPCGASTLCAVLAGSLMLWTGCSSVQFNPWQSANTSSWFSSGFDPHTIEGTAAIHKQMQSGTVNVSKSTITGIVDNKSMTASLYWTFVLKNHNNTDKEAAITIELPKNSALSRATLWINGQPQEASFSSNAQVKNAYDSIVVRHRDPLLVTHAGPNTIKVLAAPVTANGGEMQFRLGITAPLELGADGQQVLSLPQIKESNLQFDSKQDIHLTSDARLEGIGSTERSGIYTLKANIPASEIEQAKITLPHLNNASFASRLTHTSPVEYVKVSVKDGEMNLERSSVKPDCKFVDDEDAAFRVSNLWAHQEIERLAASGKLNDACDLANVYRIVSTVSGATVLEQQFDYDNNGLNRDMYRVIKGKSSSGNDFTQVHGFVPYSAKTMQPEFNAAPLNVAAGAPMLQGATFAGIFSSGRDANLFDEGPSLQGATNGTIGPQGADATVIMGVNTAGVVRVKDLANFEANFEAFMKLIAYLMQAVCIALWAFLMSEGVLNQGLRTPIRLSRAHTFTLAFLIGASSLVYPGCVETLVAWMRDANLFS